jgi:PucR family transcriptional regulator, purine catabolism regulatory protein
MIIEQGITIEEALKMECLKGSALVAGQQSKGKVIFRVNVMADYDVVDFIKPGELLLTTQFSLNTNLDLKSGLIPLLHQKGLCGIAIKPLDPKEGIDKELIQTADSLGFPIIELGQEVPFSEIINIILDHILSKQNNLLLKMEKIHRDLMDMVLVGGSLKDVAHALYETIQNPIVIRDNVFGNTFVESGYLGDNEALINIVHKESYDDDYVLSKSSYSHDKLDGKNVNRLTIPILVGTNIYGYIYVWQINKNIEPVDIRALETSSAVIALEIVKRLSVYQVESRYKIEFLENLLSKDMALQKMALEKAAFFGWDQQGGYIVMLVEVSRNNKASKSNNQGSEDIKLYKSSIVQHIEKLAMNHRKKVIVGEKSESIIILLRAESGLRDGDIKKTTMDFGQKIAAQLSKIHSDTRFKVGIGRYYTEPKELWKSYQDALKAVNLGHSELGEDVIHFDNLGVYRLLNYDTMEKELEKFYNETILPLVEYDKNKDTELVKTLIAYFQANGNLKRMSEHLYTHYNTVLYRLQRIQEITNINLENPHHRLNAQLGLKIFHILKNNDNMVI